MRLLFFFIILLSSSLSYAFPIDTSIGFGLGYTWTESVFDDKEIRYNGAAETPEYSNVSNSALPFNFYGNFRFHHYYGIELGYINYGKIKFDKRLVKSEINPEPDTTGLLETRVRDASINVNGLYISHVFYIPVTHALQIQAKAGVVFGSADYSDIETLIIEPTNDLPSQQVSSSVNASSESFAKAHLAAAIQYRNHPDSAWRLQLSQIEVEHDGEKETFTQWFTQLSYEIRL